MKQSNLAEIIDFENYLPGRLGLKTNPKGPKPLTVTVVFWFHVEEHDTEGKPVYHVDKIFFNKEDAIDYCKKQRGYKLQWAWKEFGIE